MNEPIETVDNDCKHKDCYYRLRFDGTCEYCAYCLVEYELRGCKISECNRYKRGKRKPTIDKGTLYFVWESIDDY